MTSLPQTHPHRCVFDFTGRFATFHSRAADIAPSTNKSLTRTGAHLDFPAYAACVKLLTWDEHRQGPRIADDRLERDRGLDSARSLTDWGLNHGTDETEIFQRR